MSMPIIVEGENLHMPRHKGDVGYDLAISDDVVIWSGTTHWIRTGVRVQFPDGVWGEIVGRSSSSRANLLVAHSIIDTGYRGEITIGVTNLGREAFKATRGMRLAQMILRETCTRQIHRASVVKNTERGEQGFGSTGHA